ncbi:MAG: MerR family transcriptional regulator [Dehalococcoidia bacterium]|nr:MerR family transcriptional regulator [Dehalococcoidia bacterium]
MRITEMSRVTGASPDEIRYMERKGYFDVSITTIKKRRVRDYMESDVPKIKSIIKYRKLGYTWDTAFNKGLQDFQNPQLFGDP